MKPPPVLSNMDFGNWNKYPKEYNRAVHGPYDPATYYGKPDTPFAQVKLGEIPAWLARRNIGPAPIAQAISRAYWRWQHKYVLPKKTGVAPFFQAACGAMIFFYIINYPRARFEAKRKYH